MKTVTVLEVIQNPNIHPIDIRDHDLFLNGHFDGAINIPMSELIQDPERYFNMTDTYYLYCEFGYKSKRICSVLSKMGYHVVDIQGGYYAYEQLKYR